MFPHCLAACSEVETNLINRAEPKAFSTDLDLRALEFVLERVSRTDMILTMRKSGNPSIQGFVILYIYTKRCSYCFWIYQIFTNITFLKFSFTFILQLLCFILCCIKGFSNANRLMKCPVVSFAYLHINNNNT